MNKKKYTAFFCEENIWQLLISYKNEELHNLSVLFLTNSNKTCALLNQRASGLEDYIIWDYHVILHNKSSRTIFDYDSKLGFENDMDFYFENTFGEQHLIADSFRTLIVCIPAKNYLKRFYSDRSHMLNEAGKQIQAFPKWEMIKNEPSLKLNDLMNLSKVVVENYEIFSTNDYLLKFT